MAVRKFIKMYNIRNEDVDDKGNVNPDAALYPYYATYTKGDGGKRYADVSPDEIGERLSSKDFAYDNADNSFPSRTAKLYEWNGDEGGPRKSTQIGPDMKRGFSALAYANKDKRHGDDYLRDDADAWQDWQSPVRYTEHIPLDKVDDVQEYANWHATPRKDIETMQSNSNWSLANIGLQDAGMHTIPLLVTADDSDIVNMNDITGDNYEPMRDYLPEVQLKRIIKHSLLPNTFIRKPEASAAMDAVQAAMETVQEGMVDGKQIEERLEASMASLESRPDSMPRRVAVKSMLGKAASFVEDCAENVSEAVERMERSCTAYSDVFGEKFYVIHDSMSRLADLCSKAGDVPDEEPMLLGKVMLGLLGDVESLLQGILDSMGSVHDMVAGASDKESFLFNKNVLKEATRRGGAFDWYDSSTYSDARMKDVYAGWSDVTLSDKQLKYIYDDFSKFKKGATQSNITKGLRGLGQ